jgi:hypothetical protein
LAIQSGARVPETDAKEMVKESSFLSWAASLTAKTDAKNVMKHSIISDGCLCATKLDTRDFARSILL